MPDLIDLSVYRETYLSQKRTDELCALIWDDRPDLIVRLVGNVRSFEFPLDRDAYLTKPNAAIIAHLRKKEKTGDIEQISMTGMIDFLYELDRRIRKIEGKSEIEVIGDPIAPSPHGPFPELIIVPIYRNKEGHPSKGMTQELADRLCPRIYEHFLENDPEVIFAYCEMNRRHLRSGEPKWEVLNFMMDFIRLQKEEVNSSYVHIEFGRRLSYMSSAKQFLEKVLNHD